ncbi:MAG: flagellar hook-associated protein FlgL [Oscillospiraceae bacterium]|nr:flagellar hook-associated protein FlgL [Oscillospiraceae bacterium]
MRVTNNMFVNKFTRSINSAASNMDAIGEQVYTGMKFSKASEDTAGALKAFKIRRSIARTEQYRNNIRDIQGTYDEIESTLMGISDILSQAKDSLIQAVNGTMSEENRQVTANIIKSLQDQIFKLGNTNFAGKYIFGGPNTVTPPFTIDSGKLFYNGEDMDNASVSTEQIYADIGLGLAFDVSGQPLAHSALPVGIPGSQILGYGIDENGFSNNIYNLFSQIVTSLQNNDMSQMEQYLQKLSQKFDTILVEVAGIGERCNFIEFLDDRLSLDELNLKNKQNSVESVDEAEAIMHYKMAEMTYKAALQMGSKMLELSLLDFLR